MPPKIEATTTNNSATPSLSNSTSSTTTSDKTVVKVTEKDFFFHDGKAVAQKSKQNKRRSVAVQRGSLDHSSIKSRNPNTPGALGMSFNKQQVNKAKTRLQKSIEITLIAKFLRK